MTAEQVPMADTWGDATGEGDVAHGKPHVRRDD